MALHVLILGLLIVYIVQLINYAAFNGPAFGLYDIILGVYPAYAVSSIHDNVIKWKHLPR